MASPDAEPTISTAAPAGITAGYRIGHYVVDRLLGAGGMGQVYAAKDGKLGRTVAIKLLPLSAGSRAEWADRFTREARAASALNHPNIVTVHESGECEAGCYIVMEVIEGRTLRERIALGLSAEDALEYAGQIARAVAAAHAAGIVHRDIKPDNIMIREDGYVKVLDFGLADMPVEASDDTLQTAGGIVGTIRYMSPEQGQGLQVGTPSDVFSLGLVYYEMVTGRHAFGSANSVGTFRTMLTQPALPPSALNPAVPNALDDLILTMLEKEPGERPPAARIARVLQDLRNGVAVPVFRGAGRQTGKTVGRDEERAELSAAAESAASGIGMLVSISGEAGLGKTTLVEDFLGGLSRHVPRLVGRGRCSQQAAGAEMHLPVLGALEDLIASDASGFAARSMRLLAPSWYARVARTAEGPGMADAGPASPEGIKRELAALFQALAAQSRLMMVFEDIQWADDATIDVMSYLGSQFDRLGLLMIVTFRDSEATAAKHPFIRFKLDLQARRRCREIKLTFLSAPDVERYIALEFPENRFPADFARRIHARTQGHPLFLADLLRYLRDREVIRREGGPWGLSGDFAENDLPESVRSMVQRKMQFADEADRRLLAAASIQGQQFDSAVLSKVLELDPLEVEERLDNLETVQHFVLAEAEHDMPDGTLSCRYRFIHGLYQAAFFETLRPMRRSAWSGTTAHVLLDFYGARAQKIAARLAPLLAVAREWAKAAEYYHHASNAAGYLFAGKEAVILARRGLDALEKLPPSSERSRLELALQLALGRPLALGGAGSEPEAVECFARASELAREIGDDVEIFPAIFGLYVVSAMAGDCKESLTWSRQLLGIALKSGDPVALAQAHHTVAFALESTGNLEEAAQHVELVLGGKRFSNAEYVANFNVDPVIGSEWIRSRLLWMTGYPDRAIAQVRATLNRIEQEEIDLRSACYALMIACVVHQYCYDAPGVLAFSARGLQFCRQHGFEVEPHWFTFFEGWARFWMNRSHSETEADQAAEGLANMRATMDFLGASGVRMFANSYAAVFADSLVRHGQYDEASRWIEWALQFAERSGYCHQEPELRRLKAEIFVAARQPDLAQAEFDASLLMAKAHGALSLELRIAVSQARFWLAQGEQEKGRDLVSQICSRFTEGFEMGDLIDASSLLKHFSAASL